MVVVSLTDFTLASSESAPTFLLVTNGIQSVDHPVSALMERNKDYETECMSRDAFNVLSCGERQRLRLSCFYR